MKIFNSIKSKLKFKNLIIDDGVLLNRNEWCINLGARFQFSDI